LTSNQFRSIFFTAELLSKKKEIDRRSVSRILSQVESFDFSSQQKITQAIRNAALKTGVDLSGWKCPSSPVIQGILRTVEEWSDRGVGVISIQNFSAPLAWMHDLGPVMFSWGNLDILNLPVAAILNSRKPRSVSPGDRWLTLTKLMVDSAIRRGFAIATSYGPLPYCVSSLISKGSPTIIACDRVLPFMQSRSQLEQFLKTYGDLFHTETTLFVSSFLPGHIPPRASRYSERDHLVGALSSIVMLGEINDHGNMRSVLDVIISRGIPVERAAEILSSETCSQDPDLTNEVHVKNEVQKNESDTNIRSSFESRARQPAIYEELPSQFSYIVHYTRSCPGPWPGQSWAEYCESLVEDLPGASHTGFDTLIRILKEQRIRASEKLIRGAHAIVCFTECGPQELQRIMEWRKGLIRWNFEPYGVAFARESLFKVGARPTIYAIEEAFEDLSIDLKHLFQFQRSHGKQWASEKEWRIKGDLCFADFDDRDIVVIVSTVHEAETVRDSFNYNIALSGIEVPSSK
jgi:hypothetical protein